jgi:DNA-binding transcriptional regulator GbsR (MarR family)
VEYQCAASHLDLNIAKLFAKNTLPRYKYLAIHIESAIISVITENSERKHIMNMTPLSQDFVLHFGEMGSRWGINRTVGQIYALLYVSERPLNADEIADALQFSRSNVSMGLKELESWRLTKLQHLPNDRREYFTAPEDIWAIFRTLADERRKREIDPTLSMLRDAILRGATNPEDKYAQKRMKEMHDLIEMVTLWFNEVHRLEPDTLKQLMKMGSKVTKLLEMKDKLKIVSGK